MNPMDLLKVEFGSLKSLADALGIKQNTVYCWHQSNIPIKYLKKIEDLTDGKVNRYLLRPDLFKKD